MAFHKLLVAVGLLSTVHGLTQLDSTVDFGSVRWWGYAGICAFLVVFAGLMSGLTLGLMSLGLVDLEVLQRSGTPAEKRQAGAILPVVKKQHQLLVTLLLCNAVSMEALPIYLEKIFNTVVAVILSVTFVLAFGEVIPQAICSQHGLAVGANLLWLVRILMFICFPIAYPISKVLDCILGHNQSALFRRAQLKALVSIHGLEAGKGGELSHDETTIISGALDLTEKTAEEAMTPIESTFSLDADSKLDWELMGNILVRGHSRIPVYSGSPKNIVGLLLVKNLITVRPETETPVSAVSIRRLPRVPADMPLYDILNEFQKGSSHMAAVVKTKGKEKPLPCGNEAERSYEIEKSDFQSDMTYNLTQTIHVDLEKGVNGKEDSHNKVNPEEKHPSLQHHEDSSNIEGGLSSHGEYGEVIGIITLEDVFEELLQEEIVDETDEYVDVHKRVRVAATVAASVVARSPSILRAIAQKIGGGHGRRGQQIAGASQQPEDSVSAENVDSGKAADGLTQPLLGKK